MTAAELLPTLPLEPRRCCRQEFTRGRGFCVRGCASLSFLLCPEQYVGSGGWRGSGGLGNPWKPGLGEERCGRNQGQALGAMGQPGEEHPQQLPG